MRKLFTQPLVEVTAEGIFESLKKIQMHPQAFMAAELLVSQIKKLAGGDSSQRVSNLCQLYFYLCLGLEDRFSGNDAPKMIAFLKMKYPELVERGNELFIMLYDDHIKNGASQTDTYLMFRHLILEVIGKHFTNTMFLTVE